MNKSVPYYIQHNQILIKTAKFLSQFYKIEQTSYNTYLLYYGTIPYELSLHTPRIPLQNKYYRRYRIHPIVPEIAHKLNKPVIQNYIELLPKIYLKITKIRKAR